MPGTCSEGWDHFLPLAPRTAQFHSYSKSKHRCICQSFRMHLQQRNTASERMAVIGTLRAAVLSRDCWGPLLVWYIRNCSEGLRLPQTTPYHWCQGSWQEGVLIKQFCDSSFTPQGAVSKLKKNTCAAISLPASHPLSRRLGINRLTHIVLHIDYFDPTLWKYKRHIWKTYWA